MRADLQLKVLQLRLLHLQLLFIGNDFQILAHFDRKIAVIRFLYGFCKRFQRAEKLLLQKIPAHRKQQYDENGQGKQEDLYQVQIAEKGIILRIKYELQIVIPHGFHDGRSFKSSKADREVFM